MATRPLGTGYDPNSGWPADDSTNVGWYDTDLYGNFGPGGFAPNPKLTRPVTGPSQGLSLSGPADGGTFDPRTSSAFRSPRWGGGPPPGFSMGDGLTARPATPADAAAMGGPNADGFAPSLWGAAAKALPYASRVLGPLGVYFGSTSPAETGELPRQTLGRRPSGPAAPMPSGIGSDANRPLLGAGGFPTTYGLPGQQPPELSGAPSGVIGSPAPAVPPARPKRTPAAAKQKPNLGLYDNTITRPNMDVVQGGRNNPGQQTQMGVADWSKLFQRPQR